jgi:hypothetical protein
VSRPPRALDRGQAVQLLAFVPACSPCRLAADSPMERAVRHLPFLVEVEVVPLSTAQGRLVARSLGVRAAPMWVVLAPRGRVVLRAADPPWWKVRAALWSAWRWTKLSPAQQVALPAAAGCCP